MIPLLPIEDLDANPAFSKIWKYTTTTLLENDGSSRRENECRLENWRARSIVRGDAEDGSSTAGVGDGEMHEGDSFLSDEFSYAKEDGQQNGGKKSSLEEALQEVRVERMKKQILCEVLAEVAYLSDEEKDNAPTEEQKKSRIPITSKSGTLQDTTNALAGDEASEEATSTELKMEDARQQTQKLFTLRDLLLIISAYLDASLNDPSTKSILLEEEELLSEDIDRFKANIQTIADSVSSRLIDVESSLCELSNLALAHLNPASQPSPRSCLSESIQSQQIHLFGLRSTLPKSLTAMHTTLQQLLTLTQTLLNHNLRHLEVTKHGILSRHQMSKIAFLDTVAQTMALKTQLLVLEARRDGEMSPEAEQRRPVLRQRMERIELEEREVDERARILEGVLGEYEAVDPGGRIMRKLGQRYKDIEKEMEGLRSGIGLLQRRGKV